MTTKNVLKISFFIFIFICTTSIHAESAAKIIQDAVEKSQNPDISLAEILIQTEKKISSLNSNSDKRSLYTFLGSLTEQLGLYDVATKWYATAAGIAAPPAANTPEITTEQLVLSAIRAALCGGDFETAESYLTSIRSSKNPETVAYAKLYNVWAWLCRAETQDELIEPIVLLESYAEMDSMKMLHSSIFLTLWYVTGDSKWSQNIQKLYPKSPEAAVVLGKAELLPSPFWYFLPRKETAVDDIGESRIANATKIENTETKTTEKQEEEKKHKEVIVKQQLGFFRNRENAENLVERVKKAGFNPNISEDVRPSGTIYYVVTVEEDSEHSIGLKLKTAGFECYPVFLE